jgi:uncharacterized protein (TIGR02466 family)
MKKEITSTINGIFPTPVYFSNLERNLNKEELDFIKKSKKDVYKNVGNITSNNTYILEEKPFKKLKEDIYLRIKDYFDKVLSTTNDVSPYITQSWLNYTEKNQYHHSHEHPNSFVSGVFYINADEKNDKIKFFDKKYQQIKPEIKKWNLWNSTAWWFPVKTNDIILFPSSLTHCVETKEGDNTRISLAFNVFIKGNLGSNKPLTELKL